jgi:hypothetical protein
VVDWAHVVLALYFMEKVGWGPEDNEKAKWCFGLYLLKIVSHAALVLYRMWENRLKAKQPDDRWREDQEVRASIDRDAAAVHASRRMLHVHMQS